jgi:hypothetical protein
MAALARSTPRSYQRPTPFMPEIWVPWTRCQPLQPSPVRVCGLPAAKTSSSRRRRRRRGDAHWPATAHVQSHHVRRRRQPAPEEAGVLGDLPPGARGRPTSSARPSPRRSTASTARSARGASRGRSAAACSTATSPGATSAATATGPAAGAAASTARPSSASTSRSRSACRRAPPRRAGPFKTS